MKGVAGFMAYTIRQERADRLRTERDAGHDANNAEKSVLADDQWRDEAEMYERILRAQGYIPLLSMRRFP